MVGNKELIKPSGDEYRGYKRPDMIKLKPLLLVSWRLVTVLPEKHKNL